MNHGWGREARGRRAWRWGMAGACVAWFGVAGGPAAAQAQPSASPTPRVEYRLSNGLRIVSLHAPSTRGVAVVVAYDVGSAHDPEGYHGLAHLTEHLTFRGSRHLAVGERFKLLNELGAGYNAVTEPEHTLYYVEAPSYALETLLWLESERMGFALGGIDQAALEVEQKIVVNEIAERAGSISATLRREQMLLLYGEHHPFSPAEDAISDVNAVDLAGVQWFFQSSYRPDNATLVIVGDFNQGKLFALVEKYFGAIPNRSLARLRAEAPPPKLCGVHRAHIAHRFALGQFVHFTWVIPGRPSSAERVGAQGVLTQLTKDLRDDLIVLSDNAVSVDFSVDYRQTHALATLEIELHDIADWKLVERRVFERTAALANQGLSETQLRWLRAELQADYAFWGESTLSRAISLAHGEHVDAEVTALSHLTADSIRSAAHHFGQRVLVTRAAKGGRVGNDVVVMQEENPCRP